MERRLLILITSLLFSVMIFTACDDGSSSGVKDTYYTLGQSDPFVDSVEDTLVSDSDKQTVYYHNGQYYVVEDAVIKQTQRNEVVPRDITLKEYLMGFTDFSQEKATIQCVAMDGTECVVDLSTPWEECSFGELIVYWETDDAKGIMLTLYPDSVATINEFLYYSDLVELFETLTVEG